MNVETMTDEQLQEMMQRTLGELQAPLMLADGTVVPLHETYPDSMPLVRTHPTHGVLIARPRTVHELMATLWWVDACKLRGYGDFALVLPCMPGARQDRLNHAGDVLFTAKSVAHEINLRQFVRVVVLDPHSIVTPALLENCRVVESVNVCADALVAESGEKASCAYDGVIAPDYGAVKRAGEWAKALGVPLFVAEKTRELSTGVIARYRVPEEVMGTGRYLVVDDICDGGGTFLALIDGIHQQVDEALSEGPLLDLFVTHGLFSRGTDELLQHYEKIFCTDSIIADRPGVTVLPVSFGLQAYA